MKTAEEATELMMEAMPFFINPNAMIYIARTIKEAQLEAWNEAIRAADERNKQGKEIMSLLKRLE